MMWSRIFFTFFLALTSLLANADELHIAAASDLQNVLPEIVKLYEQQSGNKVLLTFGASGTLYAQIKNGAPFDLFLSADLAYPQRLLDEKLVAAGMTVHYANGKLVLWVKDEFKVQAMKEGLAILTNAHIQKIAMANPQHAPYGIAASEALARVGLAGKLNGKIVFGENISQAAQFASSGNVDAALLSYASVLSPGLLGKGAVVDLPVNSYPAVEQGAAILVSSKVQDVAAQFVRFMITGNGQAVMRKFGFFVPDIDKNLLFLPLPNSATKSH